MWARIGIQWPGETEEWRGREHFKGGRGRRPTVAAGERGPGLVPRVNQVYIRSQPQRFVGACRPRVPRATWGCANKAHPASPSSMLGETLMQKGHRARGQGGMG
jgi:hypothetical protein